MNTIKIVNRINVADVPDVPGLHFRSIEGEADYPLMADLFNNCQQADGGDIFTSREEVATSFNHLVNCDLATDTLFVQVAGEAVGYGRCWWKDMVDGTISYNFNAYLLPAWRNQGIRRAMVRHFEQRLRQTSQAHPADQVKNFITWADQSETHWRNLLQTERYEVVRYFFDMVRPSLDNIPDCPVPDGIEIRRGTLAEWRQIWEAMREAFRDHWGISKWTEESFEAEKHYPNFNPDLWQVAWDGDEVAGGVLNVIYAEENEQFNRLRGFTDPIFVRRPWRKQGLAKALIAHSFQVLKEAGMTEAALGVDAENPSGALQLYHKMGFEEVRQGFSFHKPL